jgi:hypothetical protein
LGWLLMTSSRKKLSVCEQFRRDGRFAREKIVKCKNNK